MYLWKVYDIAMPQSICDLEFEYKGRRDYIFDVIHRKKCNIEYKDIITYENLLRAWQDFVCGKRKRQDVNLFASHLSDNLYDLLHDLKNEKYIHGSYEE